ncbi:uncharacterized protein LOC103989951 isoform X2 [Musa acuminata AAA Group]|uniref:uncharacterized protein LOC103989951 isoform X2 n=1 Tax=Musa acuminata AAA Group TaxID=214697 RepID=UPI0031CFCA9B
MTRSLLQTLTDTVASSQTKMACHPSGCKRAVGSCARLDPMVLRRRMLLGFVLALFTGIGFYLRIWSIDGDDFSAGDDRDALRREFEHANMEAMDESAEWRMRYDVEVDRSRQIQDELLKVKASLAGASRRFSMLQKENMKLQKQFESLKQIKTKGWECKCN